MTSTFHLVLHTAQNKIGNQLLETDMVVPLIMNNINDINNGST